MRYILALLPSDQQKRAYIQAAQTVFSSICDGYMISEGMSLPHITLCSFQCADEKLAEVYTQVEHWKINSCPIRFMGLMLKKGKIPPHHYSINLSVARDPAILHLHHQTLHLLDDFNITPLNPSKDLYSPHLTLAGIRWMP
jgi:2'-5' RNA ligase